VITVVNYNPDLGTIVGPSSVPSGGTATYDITPNAGNSFTLFVDGNVVASDFVPFTLTLTNVTAPHLIEVTFTAGG
jgi:hypothetical protein